MRPSHGEDGSGGQRLGGRLAPACHAVASRSLASLQGRPADEFDQWSPGAALFGRTESGGPCRGKCKRRGELSQCQSFFSAGVSVVSSPSSSFFSSLIFLPTETMR